MKTRELLEHWRKDSPPATTEERYSIRLTLDDAARIAALDELYPGTNVDTIISDLLSSALDELEASIPYEPGDKIIREDDHGDPIYEDTGMTPRFLELVREHRRQLDNS